MQPATHSVPTGDCLQTASQRVQLQHNYKILIYLQGTATALSGFWKVTTGPQSNYKVSSGYLVLLILFSSKIHYYTQREIEYFCNSYKFIQGIAASQGLTVIHTTDNPNRFTGCVVHMHTEPTRLPDIFYMNTCIVALLGNTL